MPYEDVIECPPGYHWDGRACVPGEKAYIGQQRPTRGHIAMNYPTMDPQPVPGGNGNGTNGPPVVCPPDSWVQCDALFSATTTVNGQATATLTFDVSTSNFRTFRPYALRAVAKEDNSADAASDLPFLSFDSVTYAGNELLSGGSVPATLFGTHAYLGLDTLDLPRLMVSGQNLVITVASDADGVGPRVTRVRAVLIGIGERE